MVYYICGSQFGPLVHWSIGPLVHWSIGPNVNKVKLLSERTSGVPPVIFVFYCMMAITFDVAMQLVICGAFNSKRMLYRFNNPENYSLPRRFVARRAGLAGKTDLEFVQADMV